MKSYQNILTLENPRAADCLAREIEKELDDLPPQKKTTFQQIVLNNTTIINNITKLNTTKVIPQNALPYTPVHIFHKKISHILTKNSMAGKKKKIIQGVSIKNSPMTNS